jgi:ligand-binding SRPBCC domain-containing protein
VPPYRFQPEQYIPLPLEETFSFFSDAGNLERLTPPWLHFEILSAPEEVRKDTLFDYRLRVRGIPIRWQSAIVEWQPPSRFVDEQRRGPYRLWRHEHVFEPLAGGTLVKDIVSYELRARGLLNQLANRLLVRPDLERIFDYRARRLGEWALAKLREVESGIAADIRQTGSQAPHYLPAKAQHV